MNALAIRLFGPWIRRVDRTTLRVDGVAGLLGALLVLPQAFAFASLAGLPPEYGIYTAIVPAVVAALAGSSWHVVSGPTNANSLALFATLAPLAVVQTPAYIALALTVTVLVGMMQFGIGALRLGAIANFISPAALRGFTSGAATLIGLYAIPDLLGLAAPSAHRLQTLVQHVVVNIASASPTAIAVGALTVVVVVAGKRLAPKWPYMLMGIVAATALSFSINRWGAASFGWPKVSVVGPIPSAWPAFRIPTIEPGILPDLVGIAFALTIVALGQSISIAKAVAERSGQYIDANREFRGQGLSNIVGGFFSSYVSCGSLNRSLPNLEAGARTPLAAVFASLWLIALILVSAPLLAQIPTPAIAGLLLVIAWSLLDIDAWQRLWRFSRKDFAVAAATFVATITIRIEMAILLGTLLSLVVYLYRTSKPAMRVMGFDTRESGRPLVVRADATEPLPECPQLKMVRMEGEVYFGAVSYVSDQLRDLRAPSGSAKHLLVMAKSMNFIDLAAADMWRTEMTTRRGLGGDLYFHRPRAPVLELWQRTGFIQQLGVDHIFPAKRIAIAQVFARLDRGICAHCKARIFDECHTLPEPVAPFVGVRASAPKPEAKKPAARAASAVAALRRVLPGGRAAPPPTSTSAEAPARDRETGA